MFSLTPARDDTPAQLHLKGDLTLYEVSMARDQLLGLLPLPAGPWQLDLGGLSELDSAGAQLLLAIQRALSSIDQPTTVSRVSPPVHELLTLLNLESLYPAAPNED
ncbi:STAS domain-containing protein [Pseudomonas chlororaphis]|uniref:STAS domain-containing protein n=1 Tax=unclassified Pseudomonas TaxID=196821 RepID=UPI000C2F8343|nr:MULTISPECIES: STAS domain-containing protein [unclassified Pseudomonas]MBV6752931.1 STAS domain-containing protein [Pseudomonas chlororaphis]MCU1740093.1 STAS domain-containing protein [Pseudomonas sp. 20S_6.2_Bac1]